MVTRGHVAGYAVACVIWSVVALIGGRPWEWVVAGVAALAAVAAAVARVAGRAA